MNPDEEKTWKPKKGDEATRKYGDACREKSRDANISPGEKARLEKEADWAADAYDDSLD